MHYFREMIRVKFILKYLWHNLSTHRGHNIHSPFIFDLLTNIIKDTTPFYIYRDIESIRSKMLLSDKEIQVVDYGAGGTSEKRKVRNIIKCSSVKPKYAQLLFRLVNHFKPETILEFGTSLGISSLYLASVSKQSKLITIEGCPETAEIARQNFEKLKVKNIELITGNFDDVLPKILGQINQLDFVFFDGNHQKEPTMSYFEQCLPLINNNSVFVFDDIHWSDAMEEAWKEIKEHPQVTVTIDLFFMGLVFFRKELTKQDFAVRF